MRDMDRCKMLTALQIDWEWVGGDSEKVQTNYFSKGDTTTYDRGAYHDVSDALTTYHKYSIEWTKDAVNWIINDNVVRTLKAADTPKGFPETPMQIKLGTWCAGGKNTAKGTVDWAGGYTDFSKAPFKAYYKSISIVDYAGGDGPTSKKVSEYVWGDNSGDWESIKIKTDSSSGSDNDETTSTKSKSITQTASASATETEKSDNKTESQDESTTTAGVPGRSSNSTATVETSGATDTGINFQASVTTTPTSVAARSFAKGGFVAAVMLLAHFL